MPPSSAWNGSVLKDGEYLCAVWVGLAGESNSRVLQAGTTSKVIVQNNAIASKVYYCWAEWYPAKPIVFSQIDVRPGDTIACSICDVSSNYGIAILANLRSGVAFPMGLTAPPGIEYSASNGAVWIVEAPPYTTLPNYGSTPFSDCLAGTKDTEVDLTDAGTYIMVNESGHVISQPYISSYTNLVCFAYPLLGVIGGGF
jgi:Peptidase A4 family